MKELINAIIAKTSCIGTPFCKNAFNARYKIANIAKIMMQKLVKLANLTSI